MFCILESALRLSATHLLARLNQLSVQQGVRAFTTTNTLYGEPPKKRQRLDPAIHKVRIERKIRKIEREISKLESEPRQLVPILEYQLTNSDIKDLKARPQHKMEDFDLTIGTLRAARRLWTFYRQEENKLEKASLARVEKSQTKALEHLKAIDQELYDHTITVDDTILIPYRSSHMRKETGPNPNFTPPDGYVKDISKEWVM